MNGIYYINDRISINGFTKEESINLQVQSIKNYMSEHSISSIKLNPLQLKEYYTIPHALLYDLKKYRLPMDCLIYYSVQTLEDFYYTYPAKWIILKSFFKEIIAVEKLNDWQIQKVI